jgi:hypothetical protein
VPSFVIFLCFLLARRCDRREARYDYINGMWGETDDEKNWKIVPALFKPEILTLIPKCSKPALSNNTPKELTPAFF